MRAASIKNLDDFKKVSSSKKAESGREVTNKDLDDLIKLAKIRQMKINATKSKEKNEYVTRYCLGKNLYFRIKPQLTASFEKRYVYNDKRRFMTLGAFGKASLNMMTLSAARDEVARNRSNVKSGIDPLEEKKRTNEVKFFTFHDVALQWLELCERNIKNPHIPKRVYEKDIKSELGGLSVERVTASDILRVLDKIRKSNRPTIANDALSYCKQILNYAVDPLRVISLNPALQLTYRNAGGREKPRERSLEKKEIGPILQILRDNHDTFTRENYIAFCLLLALGVRKGELISAQWKDFDFDHGEWILVKSRSKTNEDVAIPISKILYPLFKELKTRSAGSKYLFPNRRASRRREYISDDTLNHALAKLFGDQRYEKKNAPKTKNIMAESNIEHFVVHDLRRSFRTLLSSLKVQSHIAEKCLNHKPKGIEGTYDRYTYFEERRDAMNKLAEMLLPLMQLNSDPSVSECALYEMS
ncbi:tyrosine-type recombinase/integrase [Alteromonas sp. A079]|uniref:tyrosine-type recombinase/integrase n=1 Tax=Alteromonas sp. A079 TaxID=3410268 RepID=UPI003BA1AF5C